VCIILRNGKPKVNDGKLLKEDVRMEEQTREPDGHDRAGSEAKGLSITG
jgi:hypothetical protein